MSRSAFISSRLFVAAGLLAAAGTAQAGKIDLSTPEGATLAMRKVQCSVCMVIAVP